MQNIAVNDKDKVIMKLLHYFITDQGYNPVVLHGIKNEIWLENMNGEYKIIRIVSNYIHNDEQLNLDIFRTKRVLKSIQKKTLSLSMDTLSIFIDIGDNVTLKEYDNMDLIYIDTEKDIEKSTLLLNKFPDIISKTKFDCDGMDLLVKLTSDINKNREDENEKVEELFKEKKPILIPILLILSLMVFLMEPNLNNEFVSTLFYGKNIYGLVIAMFSIFLIGSKVEGFYGIVSTFAIYLYSCTTATLIGLKLGVDVEYIGPIFGFVGSLINFGSYYRVYLSNVLKNLILPVVGVNIVYIILSKNYMLLIVAIVAIISGFILSRSIGVKYKRDKRDTIYYLVMSVVLLICLVFINYMK